MFYSVVEGIKKRLKVPNKVKTKDLDWKLERIHELERHMSQQDILPFKIVDVKEFGFLSKVKGLFAYISFHRMPWKYIHRDEWIHVAPSLIGKKFYCRVILLDKDRISIHLDGNLPQFKQAELAIGGLYKGWIIHKATYGLFVDIGYHFNWRHGSIVGLMHKSQLRVPGDFDDMEAGTETEVIYLGEMIEGKISFTQDETDVDWALGIPQQLIGKNVWVEVGSDEAPYDRKFMVLGEYKGRLIINRILYPTGSKKTRKAKNALAEGEIITCEVIGVDEIRRIVQLKWLRKNLPEKIPLRGHTMTELLDSHSLINLLCINDENDSTCVKEKEVKT